MIVFAMPRPDAQDLPLFVHVLGAMLLVGSLALVVGTLIAGWRGGGPQLTRLGYRSLLFGVIPSFVLMRAGAEWIADKQGWTDVKNPPSWIDVGFTAADLGAFLLIIATVLAGLALRGSRRREGGGRALARVATVLTSLVLVGYVVAIWAMTTKPT
jgi:hypothetical protein